MNRLEFKKRLNIEFPGEIDYIIHNRDDLLLVNKTRGGHIAMVKAVTKSTWTEENLQAIVNYLQTHRR